MDFTLKWFTKCQISELSTNGIGNSVEKCRCLISSKLQLEVDLAAILDCKCTKFE